MTRFSDTSGVGRAVDIVKRGLLVLSLFGALSAWAHSGPHAPGTIPVGHAWDFTLPTVDGSRFVTASAITGPLLVSFWAADCAPCIAQLPRLQSFAAAHPLWTVLLVSTDTTAQTPEQMQRLGITLTTLRPGANVAALMRAAGNRQGRLPFSVAVRDARLCDGQFGELAGTELERISARCTPTTRP